MSIITIGFVLFVAVVIVTYFVFPRRLQWVVLLIANFIFYAMSGVKLLLFIIITMVTVYLAALCIEYITKESLDFQVTSRGRARMSLQR